MTKKLFIVSDVHSFYDELLLALTTTGFDEKNADHIFVSLGDLLDRGPKPIECLQFVNHLADDRKILIRGNHESLLEDLTIYRHFRPHDFHNGSDKTVYTILGLSYGDIREAEALSRFRDLQLWNDYISKCINFWEDSSNIFVHGWIPTNFGVIDVWDPSTDKFVYKDDWRDGNWEDARWTNGMKAWNDGAREPNKTIWCGHWHTSWGHSKLHNDGKEFLNKIETYYIDPNTGKTEPHVRHDPFIDDGIICMDACTVVSGIVNCKVLEIENI